MHELDEHDGLCGSDCRNVILYVYERELYCYVYVALFKAELNLSVLAVRSDFYSSRPDSYTVT
jgi:hypothetical protein